MRRTRSKRQREEEFLPAVEEVEASPEEAELSDFLDGLGPQGISEVSLYRLLPSGKQRFITSGPPSQFSEQYVQSQFGDGDYLARAKLNGRWYKSKSFSVEAVPGTVILKTAGHDSEIERLKVELESQRLRLEQQQGQMEGDRREREQRNHELFLRVFESRSSHAGPTLSDIVSTVKDLRELSTNGNGGSSFDSVRDALALADQINALRAPQKDDEGILSWLKPIAPELIRGLLMAGGGSIGGTASPNPDVPATPLLAAPAASITPRPEPSDVKNPPQPEALNDAKRQVLAYLLNMARLNRSPELYAGLSIEQVDLQQDAIAAVLIREVLTAPDFQRWFADLEKIDATVVTQRAWFEAYFDSMREGISGRSDADTSGEDA